MAGHFFVALSCLHLSTDSAIEICGVCNFHRSENLFVRQSCRHQPLRSMGGVVGTLCCCRCRCGLCARKIGCCKASFDADDFIELEDPGQSGAPFSEFFNTDFSHKSIGPLTLHPCFLLSPALWCTCAHAPTRLPSTTWLQE